jgi:RNA polymerase sigma factor (sigma-70 family)
MDKNIETYLSDPNIKGIIATVSNKFSRAIDRDEISSISMCTLWRCINKYDNSRGAKFTSYLYQQLVYAFKNELKKRKTEFSSESFEKAFSEEDKTQVFDIMESLPSSMKDVLKQRYFGNMTMTEIADENGYSRETARRRLKKAISLCKNIVKS